MEGQIEGVVKDCGEAETQHMKIVTASALKDSTEMYVFLSSKIQPKIGKLMNTSIELNICNKSRELFVSSLEEYIDKVREKHHQQVQVRLFIWKKEQQKDLKATNTAVEYKH